MVLFPIQERRCIAKDIIIERGVGFLTGSTRNKTIITSRFSAPGGIEVQSYGYLDAYAREYSVHNNLNTEIYRLEAREAANLEQ